MDWWMTCDTCLSNQLLLAQRIFPILIQLLKDIQFALREVTIKQQAQKRKVLSFPVQEIPASVFRTNQGKRRFFAKLAHALCSLTVSHITLHSWHSLWFQKAVILMIFVSEFWKWLDFRNPPYQKYEVKLQFFSEYEPLLENITPNGTYLKLHMQAMELNEPERICHTCS